MDDQRWVEMSGPVRDIKIDRDTDLNTIFEMMHRSGIYGVNLVTRLVSEVEGVVERCGP
jgi:hypothetical protein